MLSSFRDAVKILDSWEDEWVFDGCALLYPEHVASFVEELKALIWFSTRHELAHGLIDQNISFTLPVHEGIVGVGAIGIGTRNVDRITIRLLFSFSQQAWKGITGYLDSAHIQYSVDGNAVIVKYAHDFGGFSYQLAFQGPFRTDAGLLQLPVLKHVQAATELPFTAKSLKFAFSQLGTAFWGLHHMGVGLAQTRGDRSCVDDLLSFIAYAARDWRPGGLYTFVADRAGDEEWHFLIPREVTFPAIEIVCEKDASAHVQFDFHVRLPTQVVRAALRSNENGCQPAPGFMADFMTDVLLAADLPQAQIVMVNDDNNSPLWVPELIAERELQLYCL